MLSVRLDAEGAAALERLVQRWRHTPSEVVRRLLAAAEHAAALEVVEQSTWPATLDISAQRFRVARDAVVGLDTPGFGAMPTTFRSGQVLDRATCRAGLPEDLHRRGVLLEPLP
jgi:hypothetical protein